MNSFDGLCHKWAFERNPIEADKAAKRIIARLSTGSLNLRQFDTAKRIETCQKAIQELRRESFRGEESE